MTTTVVVEVAYAKPDIQALIAAPALPEMTVQAAIVQSGILQQFPEIDLAINKVGVFGKVVKLDACIAAGDRVRGIQLAPGEILPRHSTLLPNFPNPFNPTTTIPFAVGTAAGERPWVRLEIFNALGQKVRILLEDQLEAGRHQVTWDGRDRQGRPVASGVYLYRLQIGDFQQHRRLLIAR